MTQYIKFPNEFSLPARWGGIDIPSHTKESLENYLIHGYAPGGFITAILTNDLYRAVASADYENRRAIVSIADWVINYAPPQSWGSMATVQMWLADQDDRRTAYSDRTMKAHTWDSLRG